MTDCPNAEMRDRLPDLLHERLDARARAAVMAHVAQCVDCRAELTILREARIALTSDMRVVDVNVIAAAVIARAAAPKARRVPWERRARVWMDWRVAASIALVAAGAASFAILRARQSDLPQVAPPSVAVAVPAPSKATVAVPTNPKPVEQIPAAAPVVAAAELSAAGGVGDLSDSDLRALLNDLDSIDVEPATDPEPVSVRITVPGRGEID